VAIVPKERKSVFPAIRRVFIALAVTAGAASGSAAVAAAQDAPVYSERSMGSPDAPVTIVEYSSLLCPHCADFHKTTLPKLKEEYIDTGKVRLVFKDHTLGVPLALGAEMVARCAPEEQYFPLIHTLFENQRTWASAPDPLAAIQGYASLVGMGKDDVKACLDSQSVFDGIRAGEAEAEAAGVNSTPSFVIDGKPVIVGAQDIEAFRAVIDPLLAK
jgi:protein-disulfide isomerase